VKLVKSIDITCPLATNTLFWLLQFLPQGDQLWPYRYGLPYTHSMVSVDLKRKASKIVVNKNNSVHIFWNKIILNIWFVHSIIFFFLFNSICRALRGTGCKRRQLFLCTLPWRRRSCGPFMKTWCTVLQEAKRTVRGKVSVAFNSKIHLQANVNYLQHKWHIMCKGTWFMLIWNQIGYSSAATNACSHFTLLK
jgi:hypothetical protein